MGHIFNFVKIDYSNEFNETLKLVQSKQNNGHIIPMDIINTHMDMLI
jgi:hypothetical protein